MSQINYINKIKYIVPVLIAIAGFALQQAKADSVGFDLSVGNSAISGFTGPYVHVTVTTAGNNSNTASVTFTSLTNGSVAFLMGNGRSFDLNTNGAATVSGPTFTQGVGVGFTMSGFSTPVVSSLNGSGQVDGFGVLNNVNTMMGGFQSAFSQVAFTLTKNSGTWANAASVLSANLQNVFLAAHIFVATITNGTVFQAPGALATGYAATPDGGTTVMLLGVALGGLGMVRRYLMS